MAPYGRRHVRITWEMNEVKITHYLAARADEDEPKPEFSSS